MFNKKQLKELDKRITRYYNRQIELIILLEKKGIITLEEVRELYKEDNNE